VDERAPSEKSEGGRKYAITGRSDAHREEVENSGLKEKQNNYQKGISLSLQGWDCRDNVQRREKGDSRYRGGGAKEG